ncbi:OmpP1/FadL family transporter [Aquisalimonas asiatica]|uniref:Long-chain fatty acid transport protein n=1 Tax=Aquisalimonas asiatica TaxID=406100 RepID=A0A1H8U2I5_9GAMM|nr:outer membrane protein transport protein [Aquisalimonas asiatica]SEO97335.1 Long-chain fatty acid transport protein [Aquisalimonas asiatica]
MNRDTCARVRLGRAGMGLVLLGAGTSGAWAAGFEVPQKGIKEMGVAFGGSAALLEDASAVANNPAGLVRLEGQNVSAGLTLIQSEFDYDTEVHRELIEDVGGQVPGDGSGTIDGESIVPHFYYSQRISDDAAWGLGVYAPFGSNTDYPDDWAGRYNATETDIMAVNLNPAFSWRATDTLSVGFGAIVQYFEGTFRNDIDVGYLVAEQVIEQLEDENLAEPEGGNEAVVDALAHRYDVSNDMQVDGIAYGFNFGLLWEPADGTRIGLSYHSRTRQVAEGEADRPETLDPDYQQDLEDEIADISLEDGLARFCDWDIWNDPTIGRCQPDAAPEGAARAVGPLGAAGGDIQLIVDMPEIATLSFYHELTERWAVTGGATFTRWSNVEELRFTYEDESDRGGEDYTGSGDDVRRRDLVQPFAWEDTWRYGLGVIFTPTETWTFRAGVAYDESPVPDAERRTPRGPDSDRIIGAVGMSWQPTTNLGIDLAYTYTHMEEAEINNRENPAGSQHRIEGEYDGHLHSTAVQVNYAF